MISTALFTLSALCFTAMFSPGKTARSAKQGDTYYVCAAAPWPTWLRKGERPASIPMGRG